MATSSIFARFTIDTPEKAERFVDAIEESEKATKNEKLTPSYPFVTDKEEIRKIFAKRKSRKNI